MVKVIITSVARSTPERGLTRDAIYDYVYNIIYMYIYSSGYPDLLLYTQWYMRYLCRTPDARDGDVRRQHPQRALYTVICIYLSG